MGRGPTTCLASFRLAFKSRGIDGGMPASSWGIVNRSALPHLYPVMSDQPAPYTSTFDLARLSERGVELSLSPDAAERARMAAWLGALELPRFAATVRLARMPDDTYTYDAEFTAEIVQACVVTLEPVRSAHTGTAARHYRVAPKPSRRAKPRRRDRRRRGRGGPRGPVQPAPGCCCPRAGGAEPYARSLSPGAWGDI